MLLQFFTAHEILYTTNYRIYATKYDGVLGYPSGDSGLDKWCETHLSDIVLDDKTKKKIALAGKVIFFAAMSAGNTKLEPDVLTSHHPQYYSGKKDYASDRDVIDSKVLAGSTFRLQILSKHEICGIARLLWIMASFYRC